MTIYEAAQILNLQGHINADDIKKAYRLKAKEFHPDRNPAGLEMMKIINAAFNILKEVDTLEVFENAEVNNYPEELSQALNAIIGLHGLVVEVCGLWVWVSGDTKAHKDILKANHFKWAKNKGMWFYRPNKARSFKNRSNGEWGMDKIRETFGTNQPSKQSQRMLNQG